MADDQKREWIEDVELEDVKVKWAWSHFDGREEGLNAAGDHNFTIILPEDTAKELRDLGWTGIKENEPYEEGDPPEWTLKIKISYRYEAPKVFLIKTHPDLGDRKFRADESDLADIRRSNTEQIDVIITPSRWVQGTRTGVTAYAKELYAKIRESRFSARYADLEEI